MNHLMQDLRYTLRVIFRSPGFSLIVILTLALGIGANTAIFSIVNAVLLTPLPFSDPDRLLVIYEKTPNTPQGSVSYPNFQDWQRGSKSFSSLAAFRKDNLVLTGEDRPERLHAGMISAGLLATLGIQPILGREFTAEEDQLGAGGAVLISEGLWRKKYGTDPNILGRVLQLNGAAYAVVGVVPQALQTLKINFFTPGDVYIPVGQWRDPSFRDRKVTTGLFVVGRLKRGIDPDFAYAEMSGVAVNLARAYPDADRNVGITLIPLKKLVVAGLEPMLLVLLGAVGFVLLISCTNVANLLLARANGRMREFATRTALGANQKRVMIQLFTESVLLALIGGVMGLFLAAIGTRAALTLVPTEIPRMESIGVNANVMIFTLIISVSAGIFFGSAPIFRILRLNLSETLKEGGRGASSVRQYAQRVFVVLEVALALVLLVGAGLMIRSVAKLWSIHPGFSSQNILVFEITPPPSVAADAQKIRVLFRQLTEKLESINGVESASMILDPLPLTGVADVVPFNVEGRPIPENTKDKTPAIWYFVGPDYFRTMGVVLKRGRLFGINDDEKAPQVVVIDEVFARSIFPNEDPIGKRITIGYTGTSEIIGIVGHVNHWSLGGDDPPRFVQRQMYFPYPQLADKYLPLGISGGATVVLHTRSEPLTFFKAAQEQATQLDGGQVLFEVRTMEQIVSIWLATRRFAMALLGVFAILALVLSAIGIYGVISYMIGQRRREIGIRMALGAQPVDILRLVLEHGGRLTLMGIFLGGLGSLLLARLMQSLIYGISTADPITFAIVVFLLAFVALMACYIPARRASATDPLIVLRSE